MKLYKIPNNAMTLQEPRNGQVAAILHTEIPENAETNVKNSEKFKTAPNKSNKSKEKPRRSRDVPKF